jgi:phage-related protein
MPHKKTHHASGRHHTSSFGDKVSNFFKEAWNDVKGAAKTVWNAVTTTASTVNQDLSNFFSGTKDIVTHTEDKSAEVFNKAVDGTVKLGSAIGDDVAKTADALSMPLVVGGLAVVALLLMNPGVMGK